MVLKQEVIDAFNTLGLNPTVEQSAASTAYKKLALKHHPDRNFGDSSAIKRFQEIGEAWSICQRHFEHPALSQVPEPGAKHGFGNFNSGRTYYADDEVPLDEYEEAEFFKFMFEEMMFGRYSYSKGRRYRSQRAGAAGGGVHTFSGGFAESQQRQTENAQRQKQENEAYKKRVQEFEREQAEEQAKIERLAREEAKTRARLVSAQDRAFQLANDGKGSEMHDVIEKFNLDVTKPRNANLNKNTAKVGKGTNFETMLHAAARSCDVTLVDWLIDRGANPAVLNPSCLTPFHVAVLCGNMPVARYFISLYHNTKSTDQKYQSLHEGCHPSKATKDENRSTPLQLAIKSENIDMVELLLRDATVHDVERCWRQLNQGQQDEKIRREIGDMLLTKNGFTPPETNGTVTQQQTVPKIIHKPKQTEEEKKANEKKRKLAEEEENRRDKEARRERAVKEEAERQAGREAEKKRLTKEAEEEERRRQVEQQEKARKEAEESARRKAEAEEAERRQEAAREARRELRLKESAAVQKVKEAAARKKEMEAASTRRAKAEAEAARFARHEAQLQREKEERLKAEERTAKQQHEEKFRRDVGTKVRIEQEQMAETKRVQQENKAKQAQRDAVMRRRAEQSARDKAHNQRMREEKAKAMTLEPAAAPPSASTLAKNPPQPRADQNTPPATKAHHRKPMLSSPVQFHTRPKMAPPQPLQSPYVDRTPTLLSPPMTPEGLQTMPIPEHLFRHEPAVAIVQDSTPSLPTSNAPSFRGRRRGRGYGYSAPVSDASGSNHVGNGVPCRFFNNRPGCARGAQCAFSHVATPRVRRTPFEEKLAKKNIGIEHIRTEFAAGKARAP